MVIMSSMHSLPISPFLVFSLSHMMGMDSVARSPKCLVEFDASFDFWKLKFLEELTSVNIYRFWHPLEIPSIPSAGLKTSLFLLLAPSIPFIRSKTLDVQIEFFANGS